MRSTEVERKSREYLGHLLVVLMDLEAENFVRIEIFFMFYRSIWVSGADFIKMMDLLTEDGSTFDDMSAETVGRDIDVFALALPTPPDKKKVNHFLLISYAKKL